MRLKETNFNTIYKELTEAREQAEKIRNELDLGDFSVKNQGFFELILKRLNNLNFKIIYTDKLGMVDEYGHLPSFTIFNDRHDRYSGGNIYIFDKYSIKQKRELLMQEFVLIHDAYKPILSTDYIDINNKYMLSKHILGSAEKRTCLISMALMMPHKQFLFDLFNNSYNINEIVEQYGAIKTSTIIQWLLLHDFFRAHFMHLFFVKDKNGKENIFKIDEYWNNNIEEDINNIFHNNNSIAYQSRIEKQSCSGVSIINEKKYTCFCFYENEVQQSLPFASSSEAILKCDEMIVIGWFKEVYDFIKELKLK